MNNKLFIVSGHSGSGKTSIMRSLMDNEIVSFTTREPRDGEIDGVDYNFITKRKFDDLLYRDKLIEHTEYGGNFYGISTEELENKLDKGHAFCIVDFDGMLMLENFYPNVCRIFLYTTYEQAFVNMLNRGDDPKKIADRLKTYYKELKNMVYYDYAIRNDAGQFERTKSIIESIVASEVGMF